MYEYLLEHLITNNQVENNLRRTASEGLISRLNRRQLVTLALKYFGVDKEGKYTEDKEKIDAYRCPYSGNLITNPKDAHLDHIIPVANSGGSVIFNCIPILDTINLSKNATPLLGWWKKNPEYFSPTRLVRLTDYLMEAYSLAFEEYTPEELEDSYNDYFGEESERVGDLTQDKRKQAELYQESIAISNTSYLHFITDIILCLKANNIDCTNYEAKLKELENKGIFDNVKQFELIEQTLQKVFKNILGDDNSYITYSLNIDINKLLKSFKSNNIISELEQRIIYINNLLKVNNLSLLDYLKNLQDIDDINLLYLDINTLTNNQISSFIESIKIGHDTKVLMIIEMLNLARNEQEIAAIINNRSTARFKTYKKDINGSYMVDKDGNYIVAKEYDEIGAFWSNNKPTILPIINGEEKYQSLQEKLDNYYMTTRSGQRSEEGRNKRIEIFIEMLNLARNEQEIAAIINSRSTERFKRYKKDINGRYIVDKDGNYIVAKEYDEIGQFWSSNKPTILSIINGEEKYQSLQEKLDNYYMTSYSGQKSKEGNNRRIEIFIEMLNLAKNEQEIAAIIKDRSTEKFKTYKKDINGRYIVDKDGNYIVAKEYDEIGGFFNGQKDRKDKLLSLIYSEEKYQSLQEKLDNYYMMTLSGQQSEEGNNRRIEIFIEMLNLARNEQEIAAIIKNRSTERFKTYKKDINGSYIVDKDGNYIVAKEYDEIGDFWSSNKPTILPIINSKEKYQSLQEKLDNYYMTTRSGQQSEEGNNRRIEIFIEMLNLARNEQEIEAIIKNGSTERFKTYKKDINGSYIVDKDGNYIVAKEYDEIGAFWSNNKPTILPIINSKEKYQSLQEKLDNYYMTNYSGQISEEGKNRRIEIFIEMLNLAKNEQEIEAIIKGRSTEKFKRYKKDINGRYIVDKDGNYIVAKEYDEIGAFWSNNKPTILPIINSKEKYQSLQEKLDNYYMTNYSGQISEEGKNRRIEIFIEMLNLARNEQEIQAILKQFSTARFKTYKKDINGRYMVDKDGNYIVDKEYGKIDQYGYQNKDKKIIPNIFFTDKYANPEYDNARNNIMWYLNSNRKKKNLPEFKNINDYIDTLDKTKKETKILIKLRDELLTKKIELMKENQELNNELNNSIRRAV